jgi:hypothetical protein
MHKLPLHAERSLTAAFKAMFVSKSPINTQKPTWGSRLPTYTVASWLRSCACCPIRLAPTPAVMRPPAVDPNDMITSYALRYAGTCKLTSLQETLAADHHKAVCRLGWGPKGCWDACYDWIHWVGCSTMVRTSTSALIICWRSQVTQHCPGHTCHRGPAWHCLRWNFLELAPFAAGLVNVFRVVSHDQK